MAWISERVAWGLDPNNRPDEDLLHIVLSHCKRLNEFVKNNKWDGRKIETPRFEYQLEHGRLWAHLYTASYIWYRPRIDLTHNSFNDLLTKFTILPISDSLWHWPVQAVKWAPIRSQKRRQERDLLFFVLFRHPSLSLNKLFVRYRMLILSQNCSKYWQFWDLVDVSRMRSSLLLGHSQGSQGRRGSNIWSDGENAHSVDWQGNANLSSWCND
jgi:hypothetical protein